MSARRQSVRSDTYFAEGHAVRNYKYVCLRKNMLLGVTQFLLKDILLVVTNIYVYYKNILMWLRTTSTPTCNQFGVTNISVTYRVCYEGQQYV